MCPARIAVPTVAPGFAPYFHQPTLCGLSGISSSRSAVVPTDTIGEFAWIFGITIRLGATMLATALGAIVVGTAPLLVTGACALVPWLLPQCGELIQVMPATAIVISAASTQANGT